MKNRQERIQELVKKIDIQNQIINVQENEMNQFIQFVNDKTLQIELMTDMDASIDSIDWRIGDVIIHFKKPDIKKLIGKINKTKSIIEDRLEPKHVRYNLAVEHCTRLKKELSALITQDKLQNIKVNLANQGKNGFRSEVHNR